MGKTKDIFQSFFNFLKPKKWENEDAEIQTIQRLYLFISSTFNDMHAERDYLVKYVLPDLKNWCFEQNIELMDIDLRWGIPDEEVAVNSAVEICLDIIRSNAPMLIINFTGERVGWIPTSEDISDKFAQMYPQMLSYIGNKSITELEMLCYEMISLVEGSLYLFRTMRTIPDWNDSQLLCYTNKDQECPELLDKKIKRFKKKMLQKNKTLGNVFLYSARWDDRLLSLELKDLKINGKKLNGAEKGRFCDFKCEGECLKDFIINYFKHIISNRLKSDLMKSVFYGLDEAHIQQRFLLQRGFDYLEYDTMFDQIEQFLEQERNRFLFLTGEAGSGKSSYLARFILKYKEKYEIVYRFCGISVGSLKECDLLKGLLDELYEKGILILQNSNKSERTVFQKLQFPDTVSYFYKDDFSYAQDVTIWFHSLINMIEAEVELTLMKKFVIVLDGINQLDYDTMRWTWANSRLYLKNSKRIKFIVSCKRNTKHYERIQRMRKDFHEISFEQSYFQTVEQKRELIKYLTNLHLKRLSNDQENRILYSLYSRNPLFIKSIIEEICTWGKWFQLDDYLHELLQGDLKNVFSVILDRQETDQAYCLISSKYAVVTVLGLLAYSRLGLSEDCLLRASYYFIEDVWKEVIWLGDLHNMEVQASLLEMIHYYTYQLKHFLVFSYKRVSILYDAFQEYCQERYALYEKAFHIALSKAFRYNMKKKKDNYKGTTAKYSVEAVISYSEWPYHMLKTGNWEEIVDCFMDLEWITQKAELNQFDSLINLYKQLKKIFLDCELPKYFEDNSISWLEEYKQQIQEEPYGVISLYHAYLKNKHLNFDRLKRPFLKYIQNQKEFELRNDSVMHSLYSDMEAEFEKVRSHDQLLYVEHGGYTTSLNVYQADNYEPILKINAENIKCNVQENCIVHHNSEEGILYFLDSRYGVVSEIRLLNVPKEYEIIELWYEVEGLMIWVSHRHTDAILFCAQINRKSQTSVEFAQLNWKKLYEIRLERACHTIRSENKNGIGILYLDYSSGSENDEIIFYKTYPFEIKMVKRCSELDFEMKETGYFIIRFFRNQETFTELYTRNHKKIFWINEEAYLSTVSTEGDIFFYVEKREPVRFCVKGFEYVLNNGTGIYKYSLLKLCQEPELIMKQKKRIRFLEHYGKYLITQLDSRFMSCISLEKKQIVEQIPTTQDFLGSGIGVFIADTCCPWQLEGDFLHNIHTVKKHFDKRLIYQKVDLRVFKEKSEDICPRYLWRCESTKWSVSLFPHGILKFKKAERPDESWHIPMDTPKIHLWNDGILSFWQENNLVILNIKSGKLSSYEGFESKIEDISSDAGNTWTVLETVSDQNINKIKVYCMTDAKFTDYEVEILAGWHVRKIMAYGEECLLFLETEIKIYDEGKLRIGDYFSKKGIKRIKTKILILKKNSTIHFFEGELKNYGHFCRYGFERMVAYDHDKCDCYKIQLHTEGRYRLEKEYEKQILPKKYDRFLGVFDQYWILENINQKCGCFFSPETSEIVCAFPVPVNLDYVVEFEGELYLQKKSDTNLITLGGNELLVAQVYNLIDVIHF